MLVLSRKLGQEVCIGSGIKVSVLGIKRGRVSLGLSAPPEISIHRTELRQQSVHSPENDSSGNAKRGKA